MSVTVTSRNLTLELGEFVAGLRYTDIPDRALHIIRSGFVDTIGVLVGGSKDLAVTLLARTLDPKFGNSESFVHGDLISAPEAAWINGTAAHALDYDDGANRSHPSAVLVSAILAEAQAVNASGEDMASAYLAGYEVLAELAHRDADQPVNKGWHPTGVFGAIAATAAVANLHRLDAHQTAHALALAASQSSGIVSNFGSMTKPFHAGRAAHAGVLSVRLAAAGFTASIDTLEHPQGLLSAVSPQGRVDRSSPLRAGSGWHILRNGLNVKKYPMCFCAHRCIDALLELKKEYDLSPSRIRLITTSISRRNAAILRNNLPQTALEAKFSMQFAMATAVLSGRVSLAELNDDFVQRYDVQALMKIVKVEVLDNELPGSGHAPFDWVAIETKDGNLIASRKIEHAAGAFEEPLETSDLKNKFVDCLQSVSAPFNAGQMFDAMHAFDSASSARQLYSKHFEERI